MIVIMLNLHADAVYLHCLFLLCSLLLAYIFPLAFQIYVIMQHVCYPCNHNRNSDVLLVVFTVCNLKADEEFLLICWSVERHTEVDGCAPVSRLCEASPEFLTPSLQLLPPRVSKWVFLEELPLWEVCPRPELLSWGLRALPAVGRQTE